MANSPKFPPHPFFKKLKASKERSSDDLTTIVGYLGDQEGDGTTKLYLDISFGSYCKINISDIVSTNAVDNGEPNSPTVVWVRASAKIELVKVLKASDGAAFIKGKIQQQRTSPATMLASDEQMLDDSTWTCPRPTLDTCPPTWMWCQPSTMC
jgi:hypothetical protein